MTYDPKPQEARWIGQRCSFEGELGGPMAGKVLVGIVESARYLGLTERGQIPNFSLLIRGSSGKAIEVNMVEQYAQFPDL